MDKKKMGERLAELRNNKNETQEVVAEVIGITTEYLSKIENDKKMPSMEVTKSLAEYYDTTLDYLVYGRKKRKCNMISIDGDIDDKIQEMLQNIVDSVVNIINVYEREKVS